MAAEPNRSAHNVLQDSTDGQVAAESPAKFARLDFLAAEPGDDDTVISACMAEIHAPHANDWAKVHICSWLEGYSYQTNQPFFDG